MKSKKWMTVVCVVAVLITCAALFSGCTGTTESSLVDKGLDAIATMKDNTTSETFRTLMGRNWGDTGEFVNTVEDEDVTHVVAVYELSFDPVELLYRIQLTGYDSKQELAEQFHNLPEHLQKKMIDTVYSSWLTQWQMTQIRSKSASYTSSDFRYINTLTAMAMVGESGSFVNMQLKENKQFLYIFETGYPALVTFRTAEDGAVIYGAQWLIANCENMRNAQDCLKELSIDSFPVELIQVR